MDDIMDLLERLSVDIGTLMTAESDRPVTLGSNERTAIADDISQAQAAIERLQRALKASKEALKASQEDLDCEMARFEKKVRVMRRLLGNYKDLRVMMNMMISNLEEKDA